MLACGTCFASKEGHPSCLFASRRCRGILVVPYWPSAHYWPFLVERGGVFKLFVADCLYVEKGKDVFLHGGTRVPFLDQRIFNIPVLFLVARRGCTGIFIGCCRVVHRLAAWPLGRWTTGPLGRWASLRRMH